MRNSRTLAILLPVLLLFACNRGGEPSNSSGKIQIISTAVFDYHGERLTQASSVRCEYVNVSDGVVHIGRAPWVEGDRHWLKRTDGTIIILPEFESCVEHAQPGEQLDAMTMNGHFAARSEETYVFNNVRAPTQVDVLTPDAFASAGSEPILRSVTLTRADSPPTNNLAKAFPGLEKIASLPDGMRAGEIRGAIFPGMFLGVQAEATILAPNTKCGTDAAGGVVILPEADACRFVNDCNRSGPKTVCGKRAGGLRVNYDASFSTAHVAIGTPDIKYHATLYDSRLPVFATAPSVPWNGHGRWTPTFCVEQLCTTPKNPFLPVLFYFPAKHLLIEVSETGKSFSKDVFSGRRLL